jgi:hypothetical protein
VWEGTIICLHAVVKTYTLPRIKLKLFGFPSLREITISEEDFVVK